MQKQLSSVPGPPLNVDDIIAAFIVALKNDSVKMKMTPEAANAYIQDWFPKAQAKEAEKTKEEGQKFLDDNKTKSGIITTESGLQYQVITEGTGEKPTAVDTVEVHYTGWLLDGTQFDSSVDRGKPFTTALNSVIPGWTEGVQIMPKGSKYIFWIPSELAYGERGNYNIKPNSVLKFEIELLDVKKSAGQP
jgi:FKBP-type peptidyl-prolyl cis-trans isomerase FkpA/FKBP-type peptidyl-prolyl cis-trans isomerase FklB